MTLHTYTPLTNVPTKYQIPTPYSFRDIEVRQTSSHRLPAHPDTMGENNTPTALRGCGVKIKLRSYNDIAHQEFLSPRPDFPCCLPTEPAPNECHVSYTSQLTWDMIIFFLLKTIINHGNRK